MTSRGKWLTCYHRPQIHTKKNNLVKANNYIPRKKHCQPNNRGAFYIYNGGAEYKIRTYVGVIILTRSESFEPDIEVLSLF